MVLDTSTTPNTLVEVGYGPDPVSEDIDVYLVRLSTVDGTGSFTTINEPGHNLKGFGVTVDATGIVYAAGTKDATGWAARIESDLVTIDWETTPGLNLKGASVSTLGDALYVTGAGFDPTSGHVSDLLVIKSLNQN